MTKKNSNGKKKAELAPKTLEPRILLSATAIDADTHDNVESPDIDEAVDAVIESLGGDGSTNPDDDFFGTSSAPGAYEFADEDVDDVSVDEDGRTRLYSVDRGLVLDLEKGLQLPNNYSIEFDVEAVQTERGANFFYIFDYVNKQNFKYAGARAEADDWVIGERVDGRWNDLADVPVDSIDENSVSTIEIRVLRGKEVCLFQDGELQVVHEFDEKIQSDVFGLANRNADSYFDNISIVNGADEIIYGDGASEDPFADIPSVSEDGDRTRLFSDGRGLLVDIDETLAVSDSYTVKFDFEAVSGHKGANVFYIFDYVDEKNFKYAGSRTQCDDWVIGERSEGRWTDYADINVDDIAEDTLTNLCVEVEGSNVCVVFGGDVVAQHDFGEDFTSELAGFGNRHAETFISNVSLTDGTSKSPANNAPDAVKDRAETDYGKPVSGNVLDNDSDPDDDDLTVTLKREPANGSVILNGDGTYEYTPNDGFSGTDTFAYTVDDGEGGTDTAEVCIEVGDKPNEGPDAVDDKVETDYENEVTGNVLENDVDPDGDDLTVKLVADPGSGTVKLNPDGSFVYTPNPGFSGNDTFEYQIDDGRGGTDVAEVCITVAPKPNEGPDAVDDKVETDYNSPVRGNVLENDSDPDGDNLTASLERGPANGTVILKQDGTYLYTPEDGFSGLDTFTYTVDDGNGGFDRAEVCIEVGQKPNEGPDAVKDKFETEYEAAVDGNVLDNDSDPDGDKLTVTLVSRPQSGTVTLNSDGSFTYVPKAGFSGTDAFEYQIDDGNGGVDIAEVCITVGDRPNEGPNAVNDKIETDYNTPASGNVLENDSDPDGDDLTVRLSSGPANGELVLNADGTYEYTPNDGFSGLDTFTYIVDDGNGGTDEAEVCIEVAERVPEPDECVFTYEVENPPGSDNGGDIRQVTTSFNNLTNEFSFKLVIEDAAGAETNGFTLAINDGPNPKGHGDEMALFYFDNSGDEPVVTAYNYNGENDFSSYRDQPLVSSLAADSPFTGIEVTTDGDGNRVFCFTMDATSIVEHSDGADWTGVSFDESIGMWLHPMAGLETSYDGGGFLNSWDYDSQGWFDTANQATEVTVCEAGDGPNTDDDDDDGGGSSSGGSSSGGSSSGGSSHGGDSRGGSSQGGSSKGDKSGGGSSHGGSSSGGSSNGGSSSGGSSHGGDSGGGSSQGGSSKGDKSGGGSSHGGSSSGHDRKERSPRKRRSW